MTFASFTQDVERLIDDPFSVADRLKRLLAVDGWLAAEHQLADHDSCRHHVVYVSECRRLSVAALVWLPGQQTPIQDHGSWCVAGVYREIQRQAHYLLIERNWKPCLVPTGTFEARAGHVDVLIPPAENIHSVTAVGEGKTISVHVYGADIDRLSSPCYDDVPRFLPGSDRRFTDA